MKIPLIAVGLVLPVALALGQSSQRPPANSHGKTAESENQSATSSAGKNEQTGNTSEVKTKTYRGTLVDAACAGGGAPATSSNASSSGRRAGADRSSSETAANSTGEANRAGNTGQSCAATSSTTEFGLRMRDGQVLRFDSVGNERAKQAMTARKKWTDAASAGKEIHATVSGNESGNELTVVSIR
jgi:hypothetical protein